MIAKVNRNFVLETTGRKVYLLSTLFETKIIFEKRFLAVGSEKKQPFIYDNIKKLKKKLDSEKTCPSR